MKWLVNTIERHNDNGEFTQTRGSHVVDAESRLEAILAFKRFGNEKIESVVEQKAIVKKKK